MIQKITLKELKSLIKETLLNEVFQSGNYVLVKDLPPSLQTALRQVGYGRKDIRVETSTSYSPLGAGEKGRRAFCVAVNLVTGETKAKMGSWGGANMFVNNQVDLDTSTYPLPVDGAIIKGSSGGGGPTLAHILIRPDNVIKLLGSGTGEGVEGSPEKEELTEQDKKALLIIKTYISSYRKDAFSREELGKYVPENPILQKLERMGLIKVSKAGVQITLDGKNVAGTIKDIYV